MYWRAVALSFLDWLWPYHAIECTKIRKIQSIQQLNAVQKFWLNEATLSLNIAIFPRMEADWVVFLC